MKFDQLVALTNGLEWFDLPLLVQLSGARRATLTNQLYRWTKSGKVMSLRRGMYALADRYRKVKMQPAALANVLYRPSYLSSLWAMAYHGLIPEAVPVFMSVTTRKPNTFKNCFGEFVYRNVKQPLFGGYQATRIMERDVLVATPEKALFDHLYLSTGKWSEARFAEMRLSNNLIDPQTLQDWIERSDKPRLYNAFETWSRLACLEDEGGIDLMKDEALALAAQFDNPVQRLNVLREYVQSYVLRSLHEQEAFQSVAFVGGTALRFLENLPRFSEDLDFSVHSIDAYQPTSWLKKIKRELQLAGFDCAVRWNDKKTVNVAWVRIAQLLKEAELSHRADHNLAIKLEIDTRPPKGAELVRTIVKRHMTFVLCHYASTSLMAGKVHALLTRPYSKGRDWFDLMWYRAHRPPIEPKLVLLQNALDQTAGKNQFDAKKWRSLLMDRLAHMDITTLTQDVSSFLERPEDRAQFTYENLRAALT